MVNGLAIALIAFVAGLELNIARLRPRLRVMLQLSTALLAVMFLGIFVATWLAWPVLPLLPEATGWARVALAALLTTLIVSFSPTVTIAVIADSRARGPLSELVLAIVVLANLALIVGFTLVMQFTRWALGASDGTDISLLASLTWEIAGSFAFGAALGSVFALYLRRVGREVTLVLLALCATASYVGAVFRFEPLLVALAAGLVVENIASPFGDALRDAVERGALPVTRRLLRGGGRVAAARRARPDWPARRERRGRAVRLHPARDDCGCAGSRRRHVRHPYGLDGARLSGRRDARTDDCRGDGVRRLGCARPDADGRAHRDPRGRGADSLPPGARHSRRSRAAGVAATSDELRVTNYE